MYRLEYLPLAQRDMVEIVQYISKTLNNPAAAGRLAEKLIEAGEELSKFPYACPVYTPLRPLRYEYRKQTVEQYLVFYWVTEEKKRVTVARVIYGKRNYEPMLE